MRHIRKPQKVSNKFEVLPFTQTDDEQMTCWKGPLLRVPPAGLGPGLFENWLFL